MSTQLAPLADLGVVQERLLRIFPEGAHPRRNWLTREIAAKTVFTMLYVGAVEGSDRWIGPKHVYRMSDEQAALRKNAERIEYDSSVRAAGSVSLGKQWYADTTREPIRDETLAKALVVVGAALEKADVPTTSNKPRYQLAQSFAALFDPNMTDPELETAIVSWRALHLSAAALKRLTIVLAGKKKTKDNLLVEFPGGETRLLSPGESSFIAKAVVEEFAPRFLKDPRVIWLSESGNKVVVQDDISARSIGLKIDAAKLLPDLILADTGQPNSVLVVFVEVVASDGPVDDLRRGELLKIATDSGLSEEHVAFITAFMDRNAAALRRSLDSLAWNSFVWVASEPDKLIALIGAPTENPTPPKLHALLTALRHVEEE